VNTLKTLDRFTSDAEYETLYLFLLGCDFDQGDAKQELLTQLRLEQTFKGRLEKEQTKSAYETALAILEGEIDLLNRRKASFNLNESFEADLDQLNQVRYQLNLLSSEIGRLNIRRDLIQSLVSAFVLCALIVAVGLSIVDATVTSHGGDVSIETATGGGTRVRITLPVTGLPLTRLPVTRLPITR
jgi:hypothetical protein